MRCSQFKDHYSDFRDKRIHNDALRRQMEAHLAACTGCARFEAALDQGVELIYRSGEISLPPGFKRRILNDVEKKRAATDPVMPGSAGLAAAAMVAAAVALLVFERQPEPEPVARTSVPAAEFRLTRLMPAPQAPHVDFTEFDLPPIITNFSDNQYPVEDTLAIDDNP